MLEVYPLILLSDSRKTNSNDVSIGQKLAPISKISIKSYQQLLRLSAKHLSKIIPR